MRCLSGSRLTLRAGLVVWRQLGDLVSASTALGLHRQIDTGRPISFISEMKKRLFTYIFNMDKGCALLTGRPPALSYHYTRFELPLDLSDDVLIQGGEVLQAAAAALDENGWNQEGQIYNNSPVRAQGMLAKVLTEVLELSLGDQVLCTRERIRSVPPSSQPLPLTHPATSCPASKEPTPPSPHTTTSSSRTSTPSTAPTPSSGGASAGV